MCILKGRTAQSSFFFWTMRARSFFYFLLLVIPSNLKHRRKFIISSVRLVCYIYKQTSRPARGHSHALVSHLSSTDNALDHPGQFASVLVRDSQSSPLREWEIDVYPYISIALMLCYVMFYIGISIRCHCNIFDIRKTLISVSLKWELNISFCALEGVKI